MPAFSPEMVREGVILLIGLILSVAFHEFGHAVVADRLGDSLPRHQGRVTLNPLAHADPLGTLLFPAVGIFMMGGMVFGWGRPVQTNPVAYTRRYTMKVGHLMVAAAGPAFNIILAMIVSVVFVVLGKLSLLGLESGGHPAYELNRLIQLNLVLAVFNLLPVPPLDGGAVLAGLLPNSQQHIVQFLQRHGFLILIAILVTGVTRYIFAPVYILSNWWLETLIGLAI